MVVVMHARHWPSLVVVVLLKLFLTLFMLMLVMKFQRLMLAYPTIPVVLPKNLTNNRMKPVSLQKFFVVSTTL